MTYLAHIADRCLNRPLLITPDKAEVIMAVLGGRIGIDGADVKPAPEASRFVGSSYVADEDGQVMDRPYRVTRKGTGIITVTGSLVARGAWVGASSGLTSYEGIQHQLRTAADDKAVKALVVDMHSPGGEAVLAFETAAMVRQVAAVKPVVAVVNGMAASAAYAIASGASEIVTTETGVAGSIGVVLLHADYSRALANEGIKPTLIFAGDHKVDGNPFEPLSDAVRADLQAEVDGFYQAFLATVAKGRGKRLTVAGARKTEARTFVGQAAVDAGLADRLGSFDEVLADLESRAPTGRPTSQRARTMSENTGNPAADAGTITKADHDAAVKTARAEGEAAGAKAATERLSAVLAADGIKGDGARMAAALDLAVKAPGMSADDVAGFVTANVAAPAASDPSLATKMQALGNPALGTGATGAEASGAEPSIVSLAARLKGTPTRR